MMNVRGTFNYSLHTTAPSSIPSNPRNKLHTKQEHGSCHDFSLFPPFSTHIASTQRKPPRTCVFWVMFYHTYNHPCANRKMVPVDVTRNTNISNDNKIVSKFSSLIITCAPDIDQQGNEVLQSIRASF